MEMQPESH
jgi:predicted transcriptional regulator